MTKIFEKILVNISFLVSKPFRVDSFFKKQLNISKLVYVFLWDLNKENLKLEKNKIFSKKKIIIHVKSPKNEFGSFSKIKKKNIYFKKNFRVFCLWGEFFFF